MAVTPSGLSQGLDQENCMWQDFLNFEEEIDPFFQGDINFAGPSNGTSFANVPSDHAYGHSDANSVMDGSPSIELTNDYTLSAPQSIVDGPSSNFSWLSASPSYSTTATSPIDSRKNRIQGSFETGGYLTSPIAEAATESPLQPGGPGSFSSVEFLFNPFIAGSPHSFSSLDVNASQAFASVGGWAEQEPIDHAGAIPIPQSSSSSFHNRPPTSSMPPALAQDHSSARAITIPQPSGRPASYNATRATPQWASSVPPVISASPDAPRRPRGQTLSRSASRNEHRRARNSLTTPSPSFILYQPSPENNGRLMPQSSDGSRARRQRGRTRALTSEQRREAAHMRNVKACSNCRKRKEKCDPGIPCKSCLDHYKGSLILSPCRDRLLADLSASFLSDRLGWHPTARPIESFTNGGGVSIQPLSLPIPVNLGFGPMMEVSIHPLRVRDSDALFHNHVIYSWPPTNAKGDIHTHAVLPAVLTKDAMTRLPKDLDSHLSLLVTRYFRSFPLYCSPLQILKEVYIYYTSLEPRSSYAHVLQQALKLLVLVHVGGDVTLPPVADDAALFETVCKTMGDIDISNTTPTPCFIRAQYGSVMPALALSLMNEVLTSLEQLLLNHEDHEWPISLAVLLVLLMVIESIQYHAAKTPYHDAFDTAPDNATIANAQKEDELGIESLFKYYTACFSGCHARLRPTWEGEDVAQGVGNDDKFVEKVREAIKKASPGGYLHKKAIGVREGEDMGYYFDRLVARLLLLRPSTA